MRRLEIFRLVVQEHSVTRAAEILMVAQPAVSGQLRALEAWLGAKLFIRTGNRLVLTEVGERANEWARETLASAAQVRRDVAELASGAAGTVIVAASMAVGSYLLPPILTELRSHRKGADLTLGIFQPTEALRTVENGDCDFAVLSWDQRRLPETTSSQLLRLEPLKLYVRPDVVPSGTTLTIEQALAMPMVGAPPGVVYQQDLLAQIREVSGGLEPRFAIRLGHAEPMKQAAMDHGWAVFAPGYVVRSEVAAGRLRAVEVAGLHLFERITLLWRRDKFFTPLQQAALGAVRDRLRETTS